MTAPPPAPAAATSESLHSGLIDALTAHIAVLDAKGTIVAVNRAWRCFAAENGLPDQFEYGVDVNYLAVCDAACGDEGSPEAQAARNGIKAVLTGARADFSLEYPCHSPDQQRWFDMRVSPLHPPQTGVIIAHENITVRKQTEEQLRLNEMRLNSLLELSQKAFQIEEREVIDLALEEAVRLTQSQIGCFYFVSPDQQSIRLFTWSRQTGKVFTTVIEHHHPLDQAGAWADCARLRRPVIHNDYQNLPDRQDHPEGHSHLARQMSLPVIDQDRVTLIVSVGNKASNYEDSDARQLQLIVNEVWRIIRRKQVEQELRQALDRYHRLFIDTKVVGLLIDPDNGAIVDANQMALHYYGYTWEQITQLRITDINTLPMEQILAEMAKAQDEKREYFQFQHRLASGEIRDVEVYSGPVPIEGRVLLHSIIRDITDRKRAEAERAALQQQLLDLSRQAGMAEIATGVLHNVGNALNSVNVSVSLLGERLRELRISKLALALGALRDLLAALPAATSARLHQLMDYLDALSVHLGTEQQQLLHELQEMNQHLEHVKLIVNCQQTYAAPRGISEPVALAQLLDDALTMNITDRHAIQIQRDYAPLPLIMTDRHKLLQIIINLIRNAKEALTRPDWPQHQQRQLQARLGRADGQPLRVEISDNGAGIAPEHLTQIFAFGFTTKPDGHGFGLHASANLAIELGGHLDCRSSGLNQGAVFTLELPFTPVCRSDEFSSADNC